MSTKKIKRTWWNNSKQEFVTREYEYNVTKKGKKTTTSVIRSRRSKLIVGKNGVYEDRLKELLNVTLDVSLRAEIKAKVKEAVRKGEKLSIKSLLSKVAESKIEKMFINAGYTEAEILEEFGISRDELFNEENWEGSAFKYKGATYDFVFSYTGNVLIKR